MSPTDRRTYAREYARKRRAAKLAAAQQSARRCPKRIGPGQCGGLLETVIGALGRTAVVCPWCERQRAGVCRDCSRPVNGTVGYAIRCADHQAIARQRQAKTWETRNREHKQALERRRWKKLPKAEKARRAEMKRAWRLANPEKVKRQKRREALRQNPRTREYHAAYRATRREERAAREAARARSQVTPRPCVGPRLALGTCDVALAGRAKKCERCKAADRAAATVRYQATLKAPPRVRCA